MPDDREPSPREEPPSDPASTPTSGGDVSKVPGEPDVRSPSLPEEASRREAQARESGGAAQREPEDANAPSGSIETAQAGPDSREDPEPRSVMRRTSPVTGPARPRLGAFAEPPEVAIEVPRRRLAAQSRRDFLLFAAGTLAAAAGAWWLLPESAKARLVGRGAVDRLDTLAARVGLSRANREHVLNGALGFDDDVAEALYSRGRRVRTYDRGDVTPFLKNNYHGRTPGPEAVAGWTLELSGLASGRTERLGLDALLGRFARHEQITRLVCVEGWSAIAWWGGVRFADLLAAFPPAPSAQWAALRSAVSLDFDGRTEDYYVSIDRETAHHPQTLLATHHNGRPLELAHGAPLRLVAPMKLGLKNIKAINHIAYTAEEPRDYWAERGYSKYDGL